MEFGVMKPSPKEGELLANVVQKHEHRIRGRSTS